MAPRDCQPAAGRVRQERPVRFGGTILIDNREQQPYAFVGYRADQRQGGGPLVVGTKTVCLPSGDYSLEGYADRVAVERKSLNDLFHTLSQGRDRFERELARLDAMQFAAVMVEADWTTIFTAPPQFSHLEPKTVFRSVLAWCQRFPRVHWYTVPDRAFGEAATLRVLERFLKEREREEREKAKR
jgi:DNA excision repair protein ERCC-4